MKWTKGKHQFIVAAHTNTNNPHTHIIFNSVNLDCTDKFQDFKRSAIALRRVSDQICLEHGLSIIEKPGLSKGYNRHEYLGGVKAPSARDKLREAIDSVLPACKSFDEFLAALEAAGAEIKRGKQLSFRLPGGKKFSRQDTLGDDYSVDAIIERISGKRIVAPKQKVTTPDTSKKFNLLIDIQSKIQQAHSPGFEYFAKIYNLKEAAKTLIFLQEHKLTDYDTLSEKTADAKKHFNESSERIKAIDARLPEISSLQKHIGAYSKTLDVYRGYRDSKWSKKYYAEHESDIILHKAAKKAFDELGLEKLPTMKMLQTEYATLTAEKKKLYQSYHASKDEMIALCTAKQNVERFLSINPQEQKSKEKSGMEL